MSTKHNSNKHVFVESSQILLEKILRQLTISTQHKQCGLAEWFTMFYIFREALNSAKRSGALNFSESTQESSSKPWSDHLTRECLRPWCRLMSTNCSILKSSSAFSSLSGSFYWVSDPCQWLRYAGTCASPDFLRTITSAIAGCILTVHVLLRRAILSSVEDLS